ncbi:unnamed protein product [Parascedosporium putredinis]|uniref:arabinan endo-1,5-alpha-L-arabinosidase n=1 Tax=Parascedosporium putredinis TaxID=1442378 RepID=A0A9P1MA97_9PEZI|nr:unnamed protein product [Parascedosporium putredinis]CAI7992362.1 unnamed protein product [Parascedosporium putredinis]
MQLKGFFSAVATVLRPVLVPRPSVIRRTSDGTYFRFETGSRIGIWKAPDLTGPWVYQGAVLPNGSRINKPGRDDLWAPDVREINGRYVLYYTVSTFGSQNSAIGYATSATMEAGSWADGGTTGVESSTGMAYNAIDAALVQVGSSYLMNFGSFWGDIYQVPMNAAATAIAGTPYQIAYDPAGAHAVEGAFMHYRAGMYYLFFSAGTCCGYNDNKPAPGAEYRILVCASASATGPFVDRQGRSCRNGGGTVVLESHDHVYGPGGQGVFADPKRGTILYYHYANTNIGLADSQYQFGWNVLSWSGGWPSV